MLLKVENAVSGYGRGTVIHGLSFELDAGRSFGVLGRNGMGKTTLIKTLVGHLPTRDGRVLLNGTDINKWSPNRRADAGVALVPQGHRVFASLTVRENLEIGAVRRRGSESWTKDEVIDLFPILGRKIKQFAGVLSGGQQQMLAIGRAMLQNAEIMLMDEPTEGLDPMTVAKVDDAVAELQRRGTALLLVEQKIDFTLRRVDRVAIIARGRFVFESDEPTKLRSDSTELMAHIGLGEVPTAAS